MIPPRKGQQLHKREPISRRSWDALKHQQLANSPYTYRILSPTSQRAALTPFSSGMRTENSALPSTISPSTSSQSLLWPSNVKDCSAEYGTLLSFTYIV